MLIDEKVIRSFSSERLARIAVEMGEDLVYAGLVEHVERRSLLQNAPQVEVEPFDVGLLRRAVGVCVPDPDSARQQLVRVVLRIGTVVLDHVGLVEFNPVISERCREERPEQVRPSEFPERVEDPRAGLRGFCVPEEAEREPVLREDHCEEDLAAYGSDDGVDLAGHDIGMPCQPLKHFAVRSSDAAPGVRLCHGLLVRFAAPACIGQLVPPDVEQPVFDPTIDRAARITFEDRGVVAHHGDDGLAFSETGREDVVHPADGLVIGMDAQTGRAEQGFVRGLRGTRDIELLRKRAVALLLATVADERRSRKAMTDGFAEPRTVLEASWPVLAQALPRRAEMDEVAFVEMRTESV